MVVHKRASTFDVPLTLPSATTRVRWSIQEEQGAMYDGEALFSTLDSLPIGKDDSGIERRRLRIDATVPAGYHRLRVAGAEFDASDVALIVVPESCHVPEGLTTDQPVWGISLQLSLLRSETNWGIGDFGDLKRFVQIAADLGASAIGLNPLHAMFLDAPEHASPYSPASRLFLNMLFIDVTAVLGFPGSGRVRSLMEAPDFQRKLADCRDAPLVDYTAVTHLKLPMMEALFDTFRTTADHNDLKAFEDFRRKQGEALELFCRFQALREHFSAQAPDQADWRRWPAEYQDGSSGSVASFAVEHRDRIDFFAWAQWIADRQLAEAAQAARDSGMMVGLYRDLAVGADSTGAETWANPDLVISSVHVGAPPDILNPAGQDWGLPPFNPHALREDAYAGFINLVRANMRHAGGLRIDHVMALRHLYWIPEDCAPSEGAYVSYPMDDLIGILALESQRHRCLVVGEDLGTVPEGFRERMQQAGILSYRVVFFEFDEGGSLISPEDYPPLALATIGSHDLPTLHGWWEECDIELKSRHGLYPAEDEEQRQREQRGKERAALVRALESVGTQLPKNFQSAGPFGTELTEAAHAFLARTRSGLAMVQLDDMTGETDQVNLPATTDEYPNWRRKQSLTLEELGADPGVHALAKILNVARPAGSIREDKNAR
jgi:4-alpha-glucanotransferase